MSDGASNLIIALILLGFTLVFAYSYGKKQGWF